MIPRRHLLVAGGVAVVAAGVYLAVAARQRGAAPPEAPPRSAALPPTPPHVARPPVPALPEVGSAARIAPPIVEPSVTIVEDPSTPATDAEARAVADWIAQRKNDWISACWPKPAPDRDPPEPTTVRVRAVFDASGALRTHGFVTDLADVMGCLNQQRFDPPFAGRGQRVDLSLSFQFP